MNFYGYNTRGEVTNAVRRWGANPDNPGAVVAGQTFGYDYDPIGNRTWSKRGDYAREYAANELNQMTSRGVPGVSHLLGSADESATVTVNNQSVTRQNAYWYKDLAVTNDTDPQYPEVVIDATWSNILSSVTGNVFVAETPEDLGYDGDGNMTNDGRFAYTWDGENRLIAVETLPAVVAASGAPQVRVEYAYDHMSRRIGTAVLNAYTNGAYTATNHTAYLYDGWNLISETQVSGFSTQVFSYVWGLDLSGSLQGAGGIDGLLSMIEGRAGSPSTPLFFTADANGNIGQLLDASNPTNILAHYEYSPFGETLVAVGDLANANPFRFSTKYHEDESGLVYYGYRHYKPDIGRWVNRDPIGEWGGFNVYGFVGNSSIGLYDILGRQYTDYEPQVVIVMPSFRRGDIPIGLPPRSEPVRGRQCYHTERYSRRQVREVEYNCYVRPCLPGIITDRVWLECVLGPGRAGRLMQRYTWQERFSIGDCIASNGERRVIDRR